MDLLRGVILVDIAAPKRVLKTTRCQVLLNLKTSVQLIPAEMQSIVMLDGANRIGFTVKSRRMSFIMTVISPLLLSI